ncbi:MAG: hypothetical protein NTV09_02970 [Bacteroidetes bacterium]|nr:hypothetical protein [Bacteroidota bacterium]
MQQYFLLLFAALFLLVSGSNAATYYSRNSANWNVNSTWSTAGYGGASATGFPGVNDTAKIGNTYTVTVNTSSSCAQLDIGQGTSGVVQFSGAGTYTLTVGGNITINAGASLIYNTNSSKTHILQVGGSFTNNGTVDLYYDANDIVNTTFNTSSTSIISGNGTWALNNITISKTTSSGIVEVQVNAFETAINTLTATTGTYIHNNSGSYSVNSGSASDFAINQNMIFKVPQGTMWFSSISNRTYLYGSLYVSGGNVFIGSTAGNNGLRYDQTGSNIPYLEISSGALTVYGGISYSTGAGSDPFSFRMTGGTILLNNGSSGTVVEPFLINDVSTSSFYMSAGTIALQAPNYAGSSIVDWGICGNNGTVTTLGGTVQFGNSSTANNKTFSFIPYANAVQPNFEVAGSSGNTITLAPSNGTSANYQLMSLKINSGKFFDNRSYGGTNNDSKRMTLTATYDGVYGFYNDGTLTARTGTVVMGSTEVQSMGGSIAATFYNLTISNPAGVTLETSENVSNLLTMSSGLLNTTSAKIITCTSSANATMGSATSYVNGPMIHTVATSSTTSRNYPVGKGTDYRPAILTVNHSNNTSVTYTGEMINASATALGYAKPSSINKVSYTRYWNFTRQNVANFTNAIMTLYYDLDDSVSNKNNLAVVHDNGSSSWVDYGGAGTADFTGNITSNTISSFQTKFALGFPPSPLPVELLSFLVKKSGSGVLCDWITASETNNDYFTIERSANGLDFDSLYTVDGQGNTTHYSFYHFKDENPLRGHAYYRLLQTDFDGKTIYSGTRHICFDDFNEKYTLFPNPSPGKVHITNQGNTMEGINAIVQDLNGKQVRAELNLSMDGNEMTIDIDPNVTGTNDFFILSIITPEGMTKEKVLVEKK